jgi:hypothetical protein
METQVETGAHTKTVNGEQTGRQNHSTERNLVRQRTWESGKVATARTDIERETQGNGLVLSLQRTPKVTTHAIRPSQS